MKINLKIIISFVLALLITTISVAYYSFIKAREIATAGELKNMSEIINLIDINVTSKSRLIGNTIQTAAGSGTIRSLFNNIEKTEITLTEEGFDYLGRLFQELGQINGIYLLWGDDVLLIKLKAQESGVTADSLNRQVLLEKVTGPSLQTNSQQIMKAISQNSGTVYFGVNQSLIASSAADQEFIFAGIKVPSTGSVPMGILCEIDVKEYYNILPISMGLLQNQTTFILDQQNKIISSNKSLEQSWVDEVVKNTDQGTRKYTYNDGENSFYIYKQYNGLTGWNSFSIINANRIFTEQGILRNFIVNFALVTTVFSGILFILLSTHFTRPLNDLIRAMKQARQGNYGMRVDDSRKDEIGDLNKAYNFLIDEINRLIHEVYEEKLAIKSAQLNALQAQINPHFLYNTLDSINWMLIDKGDYESSRIIQSLGKMLRYSTNTDKSEVTLQEEINFVRNYLLIQKNRLEDQLEYEISIPEELLDQTVPKLFLQPIVENAIKHGLHHAGKPGVITIRAEEDQMIRVIVKDTGIGMSAEKINSLMDGASTNPDRGTHIGLVNVNQRIKLKYGEEYGLLINSHLGEGTSVTILLPKEHG